MTLFGAMFIIATTTWLGFYQASRLQKRPEELLHIRYAFQALEAEILFSHAPLHKACETVARQHKGVAQKLFSDTALGLHEHQSAKEAWQQAVASLLSHSALKQGDRAILDHFGETLGAHDRVQQQKQISLAMTHLAREEELARTEQRTYASLSKSLGFLSGCLLVLILL
ncbi:stage III sporulation protein AB [Bacillaceae bacterium SIJ1]|uniref:stage III sporulation protein SpoIIIAB n=1 Tax=Litoribacterium kuwaitense TaxID=1398745 RepID=UPI0013EE12AB|nr:stage III sporulation protein SpoIIIAB [Litoribacterium kuwaitense]NGP43597.1 stage III sporulation protein AB [Litoribacterium kuwaitense]